MSDHTFCKALLRTTRAELTPEQKKRLVGAWSYQYAINDQGEFHVPRDDFYWYGSSHCAYDARHQGISAWLSRFYPDAEV
ncbi:hypothetical protein LCGC14_2192060 [marine sediment metagenome]|uniref:Uncharacterized protein n=1 Tax=marine sediment metagenome TaxID=412755 RepID=A0A0F9DJC1_9ZZZZ